jgi:hypothetical protein
VTAAFRNAPGTEAILASEVGVRVAINCEVGVVARCGEARHGPRRREGRR